MSPLNELIYSRMREAKACELASATNDIDAKAIDFKMAGEYAKRIAKIEEQISAT